jgi:hypothetical protein
MPRPSDVENIKYDETKVGVMKRGKPVAEAMATKMRHDDENEAWQRK